LISYAPRWSSLLPTHVAAAAEVRAARLAKQRARRMQGYANMEHPRRSAMHAAYHARRRRRR